MQPEVNNIPTPSEPAQPVQPVGAPTQPTSSNIIDILAIVFAFIALQVVGIIVSAVRLHGAKVSGRKNTLALVGLILNIVTLVLSVAFAALFLSHIIPAINEGSRISNEQQIVNAGGFKNAKEVELIAESYFLENEEYPTLTSEFSTVEGYSLPSGVKLSPTNPTAATAQTVIGYQYVQGAVTPAVGGRIGYWDASTNEVAFIYVGNAAAGDRFVTPRS